MADDYQDIKEVAQSIGVAVRTVYRLIAAGVFPRATKVTRRASRWPMSAVADFKRRAELGQVQQALLRPVTVPNQRKVRP